MVISRRRVMSLRVFQLLIIVLFVGCSRSVENKDKDSVPRSINENVVIKTTNPLPTISKQKKEEMEKFILNYYRERTHLWAKHKYDLLKDMVLHNYYSEYFEVIGMAAKQQCFVVDDSFSVKSIEILKNQTIAFSNNIGIESDVYRVEIESPIIGEIFEGRYIQQKSEHVEVIAVVISNDGFKILGDRDFLWCKVGENYSLANMYVFKVDAPGLLTN